VVWTAFWEESGGVGCSRCRASCEASATPPSAGLEDRLEQLVELGRPVGRGLRSPVEPGAAAPDAELAASWCNGAAGYA
jgi:hypothetical protein